MADEGPELAPGDMLRIFEPFDRAGRTVDDGGLGVGLFLGRRLARAMGGDLSVRSTGDGKAFDLDLAASPAEPPSRVEPVGLVGLRVLLAEDTELSRRVLGALLRGEGCDVVEVADGEAAMAALDAGDFDLLLLDHRMPGRSGVEVAEATAGRSGRPRVVLMTAGADAELESRARAAGADVVLQKPVSLPDLRRAAAPFAAPEAPLRAETRADELRRQLGAAAGPLLASVRLALEAELAELEDALAAGATARIEAQLHRIRGMAAHFGVGPVTAVLGQARAATGDSLGSELRGAMSKVDWAALAGEASSQA